MNLEENIENTIKEKPSMLRRSFGFVRDKILPSVLTTSLFVTTTFGLGGCTDTTKVEVITKPVGKREIKKGKIGLKDLKENEFYLEVHDEYTNELISGLNVYVINNSTEVLIEDPKKRYLPYLFAFDKLKEKLFNIKLTKIEDLEKENRPLFTLNPYHIRINWEKNTEKINKEPIPLSELYSFYKENETDSANTMIELVEDYWIAGAFAGELIELRNTILKYSDKVSKILGINPDEILFDIYREPISELLYHKRVDNSKAGNIAPITAGLKVTPQKNKLIINFNLSDANADTCSIELLYNINKFNVSNFDGKATINPKESETLESSLTGIQHTITWNPNMDLTSTTEKVWVSLKATDSKGKTGPITTSKSIDINNLAKEVYSAQGLDLSTPESALKNYIKAIRETDLENILIGEGYTNEEIAIIKNTLPEKELDSMAKKGETPIDFKVDFVKTQYGIYENEELACVQAIVTLPSGEKKSSYHFLANHYGNWIVTVAGKELPPKFDPYNKPTTKTKTSSKIIEQIKKDFLDKVKNFKESLYIKAERLTRYIGGESRGIDFAQQFLERYPNDPRREEIISNLKELKESLYYGFRKNQSHKKELLEKIETLEEKFGELKISKEKIIEEEIPGLNKHEMKEYKKDFKKFAAERSYTKDIENYDLKTLDRLAMEYKLLTEKYPNTNLAKIAEKRYNKILEIPKFKEKLEEIKQWKEEQYKKLDELKKKASENMNKKDITNLKKNLEELDNLYNTKISKIQIKKDEFYRKKSSKDKKIDTIKCPNCSKTIMKSSLKCPWCGQNIKKTSLTKKESFPSKIEIKDLEIIDKLVHDYKKIYDIVKEHIEDIPAENIGGKFARSYINVRDHAEFKISRLTRLRELIIKILPPEKVKQYLDSKKK